jgi:general secretion pathway protein A
MSGGVPRRINQLCDRALLAAYADQRFDVNAFMLWRAKREIVGMN